jgi:hypothetical protein
MVLQANPEVPNHYYVQTSFHTHEKHQVKPQHLTPLQLGFHLGLQGGKSIMFIKVVVELLWTLKSHSLGQSEDQVECSHSFFSYPYLIFIDLQVIFNGKLVGSSSPYSYVLATLAYYKGYNFLSS